ncbi:hypothetical protein ACIBL6_09105 [Streptomyces sp. NPDC050400]|uniref:hypothetical protein n=1 Tax=Streptomyces sp. NPDC050400 TaxID=3365610 RepID=UPI0037AD022F
MAETSNSMAGGSAENLIQAGHVGAVNVGGASQSPKDRLWALRHDAYEELSRATGQMLVLCDRWDKFDGDGAMASLNQVRACVERMAYFDAPAAEANEVFFKLRECFIATWDLHQAYLRRDEGGMEPVTSTYSNAQEVERSVRDALAAFHLWSSARLSAV